MAVEFEKEYASKGIAGTALGLGIAGTYGLLQNGGLGGLFGGSNSNNTCRTGCAPEMETREASCLRAENATLRAERYSDNASISAYKDMVTFVNNQVDKTNAVVKDVTSAVIAQGQEIAVLKSDVRCLNSKLDYEIAATKSELGSAIMLEGERRVSSDNAIWCKMPITELKIPASTICPPVATCASVA